MSTLFGDPKYRPGDHLYAFFKHTLGWREVVIKPDGVWHREKTGSYIVNLANEVGLWENIDFYFREEFLHTFDYNEEGQLIVDNAKET